MRSVKAWLLVGLLLVVLDQVSKWLVVLYQPAGQWLFFARNTGAVFGLFPGANAWLAALSVVALALIAWVFVRSSLLVDRVGLLLVFSGVLGNLFDRVFRGFVVDFVRVGSFPIFNFADVFIVCGVCLLVLVELGLFSEN